MLLSILPRHVPASFLISPGHPRLFTASTVAHKYKLKSHSGAKKRWRSLAGGLFKRWKTGHQHKNEHKTSANKNALGATAYSVGLQTSKLKRKLLPYGTS
ncbi:hypothetical protein DL96DRAFT_1500951 [Flagelloscypha sp. PMI_526]|nr:hypothetical protein DL96DRAFT_1500951 [Flagelloscypha sp. PMI_526]